MKIKTFLSASSHHKLIENLQSFKEPINPGDPQELQLIKDLLAQKNEIATIFEQYQLSFSTLQQLIAEYQKTHLQLRKNMRILQLRRKTNVFRKTVKSVRNNTALQLVTWCFSNAFLFDLLDLDLLFGSGLL
jgi:hypothetical protein